MGQTIPEDDPLGVPFGNPRSFHPDDPMCYEIPCPPDGSCFLHADQVRRDPVDWLKAHRAKSGYATYSDRVSLECGFAASKREALRSAFAKNSLGDRVRKIDENDC